MPASQPPQPAGPTPEEKRSRFIAALRPLLADSSFSGAQAVNLLMDRIHDYGVDDVDAPTRKTILNAIRDHAGNHYFRAWSENPEAIDVTRDWLKQGYQAKDETVMPLLHVRIISLCSESVYIECVQSAVDRPPAVHGANAGRVQNRQGGPQARQGRV